MPLFYALPKNLLLIKSEKQALQTISQVPTPKVLTKAIPLDQTVQIDTGEALFTAADEKHHSFVATTGTSSCLQIFLFNNESCLIHFNQDFTLNWLTLIGQFKDKKINLILIGAPANNPKGEDNLKAFFNSLFSFLATHPDVTITVKYQQVLADNLIVVGHHRGFIPIYGAKLMNVGYDKEGQVYDVTPVRLQIKDFPIAPRLRAARKHEAEHRAFLGRKLQDFPRPEILLLTSGITEEQLAKQFVVHKSVIDFVEHLAAVDKTRAYCKFMTKMLKLAEDIDKETDNLDALDYFKELQDFFAFIKETKHKQILSAHKDFRTPIAWLVTNLFSPADQHQFTKDRNSMLHEGKDIMKEKKLQQLLTSTLEEFDRREKILNAVLQELAGAVRPATTRDTAFTEESDAQRQKLKL